MDVTTLRIVATLAAFGTFLAIAAWAYARSNRSRFDADALIPFFEDDFAGQTKSASDCSVPN